MKYRIEICMDEGSENGACLGETWHIDTGDDKWQQQLMAYPSLAQSFVACIEDYEESDEAIARSNAKREELMSAYNMTDAQLLELADEIRGAIQQ